MPRFSVSDKILWMIVRALTLALVFLTPVAASPTPSLERVVGGGFKATGPGFWERTGNLIDANNREREMNKAQDDMTKAISPKESPGPFAYLFAFLIFGGLVWGAYSLIGGWLEKRRVSGLPSLHPDSPNKAVMEQMIAATYELLAKVEPKRQAEYSLKQLQSLERSVRPGGEYEKISPRSLQRRIERNVPTSFVRTPTVVPNDTPKPKARTPRKQKPKAPHADMSKGE